jgi:hypothetical protein
MRGAPHGAAGSLPIPRALPRPAPDGRFLQRKETAQPYQVPTGRQGYPPRLDERRIVLLRLIDAAVSEQDRNLIYRYAGQQQLDRKGVTEHMRVAALRCAVRVGEGFEEHAGALKARCGLWDERNSALHCRAAQATPHRGPATRLAPCGAHRSSHCLPNAAARSQRRRSWPQ